MQARKTLLFHDDILYNGTGSSYDGTMVSELVGDLMKNTFKPYWKPNDEPLYIKKHSNHAQTVLCQLPKSISKRILEISSNEELIKLLL